MSDAKFPFVPSLSFIGQDGTPHVIAGNGSHFVWRDEPGGWMEVDAFPFSVRHTQQEEAASIRRRAEQSRLERERVEHERQLARERASSTPVVDFVRAVLSLRMKTDNSRTIVLALPGITSRVQELSAGVISRAQVEEAVNSLLRSGEVVKEMRANGKQVFYRLVPLSAAERFLRAVRTEKEEASA